jgi:hypothetical protein
MASLSKTYKDKGRIYKKIRSDSKIISSLQTSRKATYLSGSLSWRESIDNKLSRINLLKKQAENYQK